MAPTTTTHTGAPRRRSRFPRVGGARAWLPSGDDDRFLTASLHHDQRGLSAWQALRPRFVLDDADDEQSRLLPLVLRTLAATGVSDPDQQRMEGLRRYSRIRSMLVMWSAAEAIEALSAASIEVMVLKGTALAGGVYDDPALRPMVDSDLLVRPVDLPGAVQVLEGLGYQGTSRGDRREMIVRHGLAFQRRDGVEIDLHWMPHRSLASPGLSRTFPRLPWEAGLAPDEWWARARPIAVGDATALAPAPTDLLLHVCLHGAYSGANGRLRWAADAAALLRADETAIDWDLLVAQARRRRASHTLAAALGYLHEAQSLPVPPEVVAALAAAAEGPRARVAERWSTRPLPRRSRVAGDLPNTAVRYLLLTRQDPPLAVVRGTPGFLAAGWGLEAAPVPLVRAVATKVWAVARR